MAATIKDIREKTGLSLATISKYLNGGNVLPGKLDFTFDARSSVVKDAQSANGQEIQAFNILFTIGTSSGR